MNIAWKQLNVGCLSRNRYWGEADDGAYRSARCSSTLIASKSGYVLVDPGVKRNQMEVLLDERWGVTMDQVHTIFFTHLHGDHRVDWAAYPGVRLIASKREIDDFANAEGDEALLQRLLPAGGELFPGIRTVPLPGHTAGMMGLTFDGAEGKVLIAGDAVMTKDFFLEETGYFNSWDLELASETIRKIRKEYDCIVPGHDMLFYNQRG